MKKVLCFALSVIMVFATFTFPINVSATDSSTGNSYIYIRTDSFSQVVETTGVSLVYEGQILFKPASTLSFLFDMKDDTENAVFNFYGGNSTINVEVKADGESVYTELTAKGSLLSVADRGVIAYSLTNTDALKNANKKFVVRVTNNGSGDGLITAASVNAFAKETLNYIAVNPFTESESKYTVENNVVSRYMADTTPNLRLPYSTSYVIYKFNLDNSLNSLSYNVKTIGGDLVKVQISSDKVNWTDLSGLSGDIFANVTGLTDKTFYLKCLPDPNSSGATDNKQSYITSLTLYAGYESAYSYVRTASYGPIIEQTGGSQVYTEAAKDVILLNSGSTISTQMNLRDDVVSAILNVYCGITLNKVEVKADGETGYTELTPQGSLNGNGRGTVPFNLTVNDALKAANKKFVVRVTNTSGGQTYVYGISANAFDKESSTSIKMNALTESELKYTVKNNIVDRYINGDIPGIQLKTKDSYVIYKFNLANDLNALSYNIGTFGGNTVLVQFSSDMVNWTDLSGLSGDIFANVLALSDKVFYIKCLSDPSTPNPTDNQAYVTNITLTAGFANIDNNVDTYQYIRTNNFDNLFASTGNKIIYYDTSFYQDAPAPEVASDTFKQLLNLILFSPASTLSFQFDLKNDVQTSVFNLYGGNSTYKVEVKADGESSYTEVFGNGSIVGGSRGVISYNLTTSDALKSDNNKFIVRVTNSGGSDGILYAVSVNAFAGELGNTLQMNSFTESELKYTVANNMVSRYHAGDTANIQLKTSDSFIVYKFSFLNDFNTLSYNVGTIGGDLVKLQYSTDMTNWSALSGLSGSFESSTKTLYIKCMSDPNTTNPTNNQAYVTNVTLTTNPLSFGTHKVTGSKITNIAAGSTVTDFLVGVKVTAGTTITVRNSADTATIVTDNAVGTGTIVKVTTDGITSQYTMVVFGDLTGDGVIALEDLVAVRDDILETTIIENDVFKTAGELYKENRITLNSLVGIMAYISEAGTINQNR